MFELCASIQAADFANLVRAISFGTWLLRTLVRLTTKPLDVHLMVEKPLDFLPELEELGVKRVSVHYEIPGGPEASAPPGCKPGWYSTPKRRWNRPCRTWPKFRSCC